MGTSTGVSVMDTAASAADRGSAESCAVCMDQDADTLLFPCEHTPVCYNCSEKLKRCPRCNVRIDGRCRLVAEADSINTGEFTDGGPAASAPTATDGWDDVDWEIAAKSETKGKQGAEDSDDTAQQLDTAWEEVDEPELGQGSWLASGGPPEPQNLGQQLTEEQLRQNTIDQASELEALHTILGPGDVFLLDDVEQQEHIDTVAVAVAALVRVMMLMLLGTRSQSSIVLHLYPSHSLRQELGVYICFSCPPAYPSHADPTFFFADAQGLAEGDLMMFSLALDEKLAQHKDNRNCGQGLPVLYDLVLELQHLLQEYANFAQEEDVKQTVSSDTGPAKQKGTSLWACPACTFVNSSARRLCEICGNPENKPEAEGQVARATQTHRRRKLEIPSEAEVRALVPASYHVTSAKMVASPFLRKRFERKFERMESRVQLAFHGTSQRRVRGIEAKGLVVPGQDPTVAHATDTGWFGRGIYVARDMQMSLWYGSCLFVCLVLPGKTNVLRRIELGVGLASRYDSHSSPDGRELVLFSPAQVLPCWRLNVTRQIDAKNGVSCKFLPSTTTKALIGKAVRVALPGSKHRAKKNKGKKNHKIKR
eukprot:g34800.t1